MKKGAAILLTAAAIMLGGCKNTAELTDNMPAVTTKTHVQKIIIETTAYSAPAVTEASTHAVKDYGGTMIVHFIDVGQGDSIFIELPDESSVLIDAGESAGGNRIVSYIKALGYDTINYLIASHPHADHIGGIPVVMENFKITRFYLSSAVHTTDAFEKMLDTVAKRKINTATISKGDVLLESGYLKIEVLSPDKGDYSNINNASAVILVTYGETAFLFMGDAENEAERMIKPLPKCNVLKVAHHGSVTSTSDLFLDGTSPEIAVISCGANNAYGHPSEEVIKRLESKNIEVLRTDLEGDIIIYSDGNYVGRS